MITNPYKVLGVPDVMLRDEKDMFLDSITISQLEKRLGARIKILPSDGAGTLRAVLGEKTN